MGGTWALEQALGLYCVGPLVLALLCVSGWNLIKGMRP